MRSIVTLLLAENTDGPAYSLSGTESLTMRWEAIEFWTAVARGKCGLYERTKTLNQAAVSRSIAEAVYTQRQKSKQNTRNNRAKTQQDPERQCSRNYRKK